MNEVVFSAMKLISLAFTALLITTSAFPQSKYGLSCYRDACAAVDHKAESRIANARTICGSGDSTISYRRGDKPPAAEMQRHWRNILSAEHIAQGAYSLLPNCAHADLIVKSVVDTLFDKVSIEVTDSDSGEAVFSESRSIHDEQSDLTHIADHFYQAAVAAKAATGETRRERMRQAELEAEAQRCQNEADSLRQDIIAYTEVQHIAIPEEIQKQISEHNSRCSNPVSTEIVQQQRKAEADAKAAQEQAAQEETLRQKWAARLKEEKSEAFAVWKQRLGTAPFVPPVEGWAHEAGLGGALWYIILPKTGIASNCHLVMNGSHAALDCFGSEVRSDYVPVLNNNRRYLLKAKSIKTGEHAATVKDGGRTLCLRDAGCYQVLAEVRQEPTELPDKLQVPAPGTLSGIYSSDDIAFNYPQNWNTEEKKNKDNVIVQVDVSPPEAHLAHWVTHGFFIVHVLKMSEPFPHTLDGAYDQLTKYERARGLVIADARTLSLGESQGKMSSYSSPSVFSADESGWVAVVKDKGEGYYYVLMFYPSTDDGHLYAQTFNEVLKTFKFKK